MLLITNVLKYFKMIYFDIYVSVKCETKDVRHLNKVL